VLHFTTKGDNRVWRYDVVAQSLAVAYDDETSCNPVLTGVDNVTVSRSGDVFVAEDGGDMQLVVLGADGSVSPFVEVAGQRGSEITGPAFSPDGSCLYFSSQRGDDVGLTYEVRGPFR
jgi:secreted PhoX family phosphatase